MKYPLVFYVNKIPRGFHGMANGPIIRILKTKRHDEGLRDHELVHVKQWFRTCGLYPFLNMFRKLRYKFELEAYRKQIEYSPHLVAVFAGYICKNYNLRVQRGQVISDLNK